MITVSLYQLVLVRGTRHLWPDWFNSFCDEVERNPGDRAPFGICADKCDDEGEVELANVLRWFGTHTEVRLTDELTTRTSDQGFWRVANLPPALNQFQIESNDDNNDDHERIYGNPLYRIAKVGLQIEKAKSQL